MITELEDEIWKEISGYEGLYWVSNLGRIKSADNILNQYKSYYPSNHPDNKKYRLFVGLFKAGKKKDVKVSRLVAKAFVPNPDNKPQVRHKDLDPTNSRWDNLLWTTHKEGVRYAVDNGAWDAVPNEKKFLKVKKTIIQYDSDGANELSRFVGVAKASRDTGVARANIKHCLRGRQKSAGGYVWKYARGHKNIKS
jgi:hypothetical protein